VGSKGLERKIDSLPVCAGGEMCSVGLPRSHAIKRAEMNRIFLIIASDAEAHPCVPRGIEFIAHRSQIECRLNEAAVILYKEFACKVQARTIVNYVAGDGGGRNSPHDLITDSTPRCAHRRDQTQSRKIVYHHRIIRFLSNFPLFNLPRNFFK
jgi:hypothetical protein